MALAVLMTTGSAFAQLGSKTPEVQNDVRGTGKELLGTEKLDPAQLRLTDTQKSAIAEAVRKERKAVVEPPKFVVSIGAPVPPAIELYMLPDVVLSQVPAAKSVKFTVVDNQLVLVDPTTMRVVDVIPR
jgi:hypothetical protein